MTNVKYPTRCEIIDPDGHKITPELAAKAPDASKPHIGKKGLAEKLGEWEVRITLDDGTIIYGHECWWVPLPDEEKNE